MKIKFEELKKGACLSEVQYYRVVKVSGTKIQLKNGLEQDIVVDKEYVQDCLTSADQYTEEVKVTKTEMAKLFLENPNVVFTISFNKQVKPEDVSKEIMGAYEGSTPKTMEMAIKKAVKSALNGIERVLVGYHNGIQDDLGRISAIDMNIEKDPTKDYNNALRLVDPRTINYLILRGKKYIVK
jgi:hypothetical protein